MISINRLKEMALEDIEENPEKHLEEYTELLQQLDQLKAENEKLKIALKFRDSSIDAKDEEILKKCKNNRELIDKNWKLIKTLTEIKEIAETCSFTDSNKLLLNRLEHILQKISGVENG